MLDCFVALSGLLAMTGLIPSHQIELYFSNTATARIGEPVPPRHFNGRPMN